MAPFSLTINSKLFDFPIILTEQYPKWLGPTLPELAESLPAFKPITKLHFNCCDVYAHMIGAIGSILGLISLQLMNMSDDKRTFALVLSLFSGFEIEY